MYNKSLYDHFPIISIFRRNPDAIAEIKGGKDHPQITGTVKLYRTDLGTIVFSEIKGLPETHSACSDRIFAFHIHKGSECSGDMNDQFSNAMSHYDPDNCEHPYHAGDMPPLFSNNGYALSVFLTDRFSVNEVIGRTVIIHDRPDDFTTQPSGNSGTKIACGVIRANKTCRSFRKP